MTRLSLWLDGNRDLALPTLFALCTYPTEYIEIHLFIYVNLKLLYFIFLLLIVHFFKNIYMLESFNLLNYNLNKKICFHIETNIIVTLLIYVRYFCWMHIKYLHQDVHINRFIFWIYMIHVSSYKNKFFDYNFSWTFEEDFVNTYFANSLFKLLILNNTHDICNINRFFVLQDITGLNKPSNE